MLHRFVAVNCRHETVTFSSISGVDGSLFEGSLRDLARGGWAVTSYLPNGDPKFISLYGPLPGFWHTILRAELYALFIFLMHAVPPFSLAIDNFTVIKGLRRGEAYCTVPRRAHADLWRRIWFKLRDLGAIGGMRVFFSAEDYPFKPYTHFLIIKTESHQVESSVPTPQLPHFRVNSEVDVHAKHGGLLARAPPLIFYIMKLSLLN